MSELGKYIVFEGGEGTGKSTQVSLLAEEINAYQTREPGGDNFGARMRSLLLDPACERINPITDVLVFAATRAELVQTTIEPLLATGHDVVSDRSWISSAAYQGATEKVSLDTIRAINELAIGKYMQADLVVLLDGDPDTLHEERLGRELDYFERQGRGYHRIVRELFLQLGAEVDAVVIDAHQDIETIQTDIRTSVHERLGI